MNVRITQTMAYRLPQMRQVFMRHRHRQRDRDIRRREIGQRLLLHLAQIGTAQGLVPLGLQTIELQIHLQAALAEDLAEFLAQRGIFGKAHTVRPIADAAWVRHRRAGEFRSSLCGQ